MLVARVRRVALVATSASIRGLPSGAVVAVTHRAQHRTGENRDGQQNRFTFFVVMLLAALLVYGHIKEKTFKELLSSLGGLLKK